MLVFCVSKRGIPLYVGLQQGVDAMVRTVRENISGIRVIKALSKTEYERERFAKVNGEVVRREKKAGITMALTNPMMNLLLNVGLTLVIVVGAYRVNAGVSSAGNIIAFLSYFTIILNAMMAVTRIFVMCSKGIASGARIQEVLDTPEDLAVHPEEPEDSPYHVVFDHVSFSYNKNEPSVEDISFRLKPGETLGIIGATGCGKSTLMSLLMRLYDADSGLIQIGGHRLSSIPLEELHQKFGVVFQNDVLFADSIYENIDFGRNLPPRRLRRRPVRPGLEFISALPDGFGTCSPARAPTSAAARSSGFWWPGLWRALRNFDSGRLLLRPGLPHRRRPAEGPAGGIPGHHHHHHRPAGQLHPARRPYSGAGRGQRAGLRHP